MKYDGNTVFAPFNGGLYGMDDDSDRALQHLESKDNIKSEFERTYGTEIKAALEHAGLRYVGLEYYSPRFYNFSTDSLDLELEIADADKLREFMHSRKDAIEKALRDNHSRDGFMSSTPDTFAEALTAVDGGDVDILTVKEALRGISFSEDDLFEWLVYDYPCEKCEWIHSEFDNYDGDVQDKIKACPDYKPETVTA